MKTRNVVGLIVFLTIIIGSITGIVIYNIYTSDNIYTGVKALDGYTLFAPIAGTTAYLIDMDGNIVHEWGLSGNPGHSVYLLEDGTLLSTYNIVTDHFEGSGVSGGGLEMLDWEGNQLWSYELSNETFHLHHDVEYMSNGHILVIAYEKISEENALAAGVLSSLVSPYGEVWAEVIFEIDTNTDSIIWQWHVWDHILPEGYDAQNYPELIDPNYPTIRRSADWLHFNSIDYNEALDQIMLSSRQLNEIWIIDHNTTTAQAAGSAGNLLYRWGNPEAYGESGTRELYGQHDVEWIDSNSSSSNILLFNNGHTMMQAYSTILELDVNTPYSYGEVEIIWEYGDSDDEESFFSERISGAQRLENGNTLICSGVEGWFFEVTSDGKKVWEFTYGGSIPDVYRAERYSLDYSGLLI